MLTKPVIIGCLLGVVVASLEGVLPTPEEAACTPAVKVECQEVHKPVCVETYLQENTILEIPGCQTIEVRNAPTQLSTVVTATLTYTSTRYAYVSC